MPRWARAGVSVLSLLLCVVPGSGCFSDTGRNSLEAFRAPSGASPLSLSGGSSGAVSIKHNLVNNAAEAQVEITARLRNASSDDKTATVVYTIFDAAGKQVETTRATADVPAHADAESVGCLIVQKPRLSGGVESPYRYQAAIELRDGDTLVERMIESIDFLAKPHPVAMRPSAPSTGAVLAD